MDVAHLAMVEQKLRDPDKFYTVLIELLNSINRILENPHNTELRKIRSDALKDLVQLKEFVNYLTLIGFRAEEQDNEFIYPKENALSNLSKAKETIERKIYLCYGSLPLLESKENKTVNSQTPTLYPVNVLTTRNEFLLKIQNLFNMVLQYEDSSLQEIARNLIPIDTLRLLALKRMREHQKLIKEDDFEGEDLSFDTALLMELLAWFKQKFFTWVDRPPCSLCEGPTTHVETVVKKCGDETCRAELYKCSLCGDHITEFPRYNNPLTLLRTRRGRCGEWANCFTLLCRALRYETRYVYDTTDHVWCEVFDIDSNQWVHVDPCEMCIDAPLLYSHGWGKKLSYVIAFSCDDLQDVTWRYTTHHKEVLKRRTLCEESEIVWAIQTLRNERQKQLSEARRKYLNIRFLKEVVDLMVERKPSESENFGRISGSAEWRRERGEMGTSRNHVFNFDAPGLYTVSYSTSTDRYQVLDEKGEITKIDGWREGTFESKNIFKKLEHDWNMVYLAREEGEDFGSISWKLNTKAGLKISTVEVKALTQVYSTGVVRWTLSCDDKKRDISVDNTPKEIKADCKEMVITVVLSGGTGDVAWQHAQLCRQSTDSRDGALQIYVRVVKNLDKAEENNKVT